MLFPFWKGCHSFPFLCTLLEVCNIVFVMYGICHATYLWSKGTVLELGPIAEFLMHNQSLGGYTDCPHCHMWMDANCANGQSPSSSKYTGRRTNHSLCPDRRLEAELFFVVELYGLVFPEVVQFRFKSFDTGSCYDFI